MDLLSTTVNGETVLLISFTTMLVGYLCGALAGWIHHTRRQRP